MSQKIIEFFKKNYLYILPYIAVFVGALYRPTDPDLGWHLKYGEYFFKHGEVLRDNTFSTMMPDYHWANTSWVTDLITYTTFSHFAFFGLTLLSAFVITLTFFFFSRAFRLSPWNQVIFFPLLLLAEESVNLLSFRGQQLTFLFLGVLFFILSFYEEQKEPLTKANAQKLFFLIPLFLLWVNIHGEFILGLGILAIWLAIRIARQMFLYKIPKIPMRKEVIFLAGIFLASAAATIINPFGIHIHLETIAHFGNPALKDIVEYLPFDTYSQNWWIHLISSLAIVAAFVFFYDNEQIKEKLPTIGIFFVLLVMSFLVRRYTWPMYYIALPLLTPVVDFIKPDKKYLVPSVLALFVLYLSSMLYLKRPVAQYVNMSWEDYAAIRTISIGAPHYIATHNLGQNILTVYDWGGFLIWNFPNVKPSIDGRMHLWKDEKGYSAFTQYIKLEQNVASVDNTKYNVVLMSKSKAMFDQMAQLVYQNKWKVVYEDKISAVFIRN